jgi:hypothetical protein
MDIKRMLISVAVRILAENTNIVRKPDSMETFVNNLFGGESDHDRMVRELDEASSKAIEAAKKFATDRKFKKITKDF